MATHVTQSQTAAPGEVNGHYIPQVQVTHLQMTLLIAYIIVISAWVFQFMASFTRTDFGSKQNSIADDPVQEVTSITEGHECQAVNSSELMTVQHNNSCNNEEYESGKPRVSPTMAAMKRHQKQDSTPLQPQANVTLGKFIVSVLMFGLIMIFFYLCDYKKIFPQGDRKYSRDTFLFLVFLLFLVACSFTVQSNQDKILNREQTEEWKGWMQVLFVWYHYFMAKEWYNWIRVYIASYVWMTGFGNFSFFWIRNDYSIWRLLKMLFRLNILVIFIAMTTNNGYMLYYICAMHTYWFLTVYAFMRTLPSWNKNRALMPIKFLIYAICNAIIFDIPGFSSVVFRPFSFVLGLHDNSTDVLHEWTFRAGLDHWACFLGMLCAYNYHHFEAFMLYLDSKSMNNIDNIKKVLLRYLMAFGCVVLAIVWYSSFMSADKYTYNRTHPYTSMIPILIFIVARNIHPVLRKHHIHLFAFLGKITLETYLSQLHIYLLSNAHTLLIYIPEYPLLNFAFATISYLTISQVLFNITNNCSTYLIPKDYKKLLIHGGTILALFGVSTIIAYIIMYA